MVETIKLGDTSERARKLRAQLAASKAAAAKEEAAAKPQGVLFNPKPSIVGAGNEAIQSFTQGREIDLPEVGRSSARDIPDARITEQPTSVQDVLGSIENPQAPPTFEEAQQSNLQPEEQSVLDKVFSAVGDQVKQDIFATTGIRIAGFDPEGQTFTSPVGVPGAGTLVKTGAQTSLSSFGKGGIKTVKDYFKKKSAERAAAKVLTGAEKAGAEALTKQRVLDLGTEINSGRLIKNSKEAATMANEIIKGAKIASPTNWQKITGFLRTNQGILSLAAVSEFVALNLFGDNVDRLGFAAEEIKDTNPEGALELLDLQAEAGEFISKWPSYVPGLQLIPSVGNFVKDQLKIGQLKREGIYKKIDEQQLNQELGIKFEQGIISNEELEVYKELNPDQFAAAKEITQQELTDVADTSLSQSAALVEKVKTGGANGGFMTDLEIINDPEFIAASKDSRVSFDAPKKIYDQALARVVAQQNSGGGSSGFSGSGFTETTGGTRDSIEPRSTLGFGLLETDSEFVPGEPGTPVPTGDVLESLPEPTRPEDEFQQPLKREGPTQTGNPPNTYETSTKIYTDAFGRGPYIFEEAPPGAQLI